MEAVGAPRRISVVPIALEASGGGSSAGDNVGGGGGDGGGGGGSTKKSNTKSKGKSGGGGGRGGAASSSSSAASSFTSSSSTLTLAGKPVKAEWSMQGSESSHEYFESSHYSKLRAAVLHFSDNAPARFIIRVSFNSRRYRFGGDSFELLNMMNE